MGVLGDIRRLWAAERKAARSSSQAPAPGDSGRELVREQVMPPASDPSEERAGWAQVQAVEDKGFERDWDSYSDLIDGRKEAPEWEVIRQVRLTHWQEFFRIKPDQRVLDAGCGNGDYTVLACRAGARVWAFDLAPRMVETPFEIRRSSQTTPISSTRPRLK